MSSYILCGIYVSFVDQYGVMGIIRLAEAPDPEILTHIGARLRTLRKASGLTMEEAAEGAGVARKTVYRAEMGDNPTLLTLVRLLRVYDRLSALEQFIPDPEVSPMALLRDRARADGSRTDG